MAHLMMLMGAEAFNTAAPLTTSARAAVSMTAITPGDIGTTKPLGVYDPLGLMTSMPDKYRRWQEMEIKHGRLRARLPHHGRCALAGLPLLRRGHQVLRHAR